MKCKKLLKFLIFSDKKEPIELSTYKLQNNVIIILAKANDTCDFYRRCE